MEHARRFLKVEELWAKEELEFWFSYLVGDHAIADLGSYPFEMARLDKWSRIQRERGGHIATTLELREVADGIRPYQDKDMADYMLTKTLGICRYTAKRQGCDISNDA